VTDFSAPVSLLKKEYNQQNALFASQPPIGQWFLTGQAQQITENLIILENAFFSEKFKVKV
jgi:hypothetical protein